MTLCSFGGVYCLHLQVSPATWRWRQYTLPKRYNIFEDLHGSYHWLLESVASVIFTTLLKYVKPNVRESYQGLELNNIGISSGPCRWCEFRSIDISNINKITDNASTDLFSGTNREKTEHGRPVTSACAHQKTRYLTRVMRLVSWSPYSSLNTCLPSCQIAPIYPANSCRFILTRNFFVTLAICVTICGLFTTMLVTENLWVAAICYFLGKNS
jgi:hypothetical protein